VLLGFGIGAHGQPDVVGVLDEAGPHLLAVDHVVVAVAHRGGAQRGEVGARAGFGVADREVQFTGRDLGQEEFLLLVGTERHDRRRDAVDGQEWHRGTRDSCLVGEDQLIHRRAGLTAVLLRPGQRQPSVAAHLGDGVAVRVALAVLALRRAQRLDTVGRHQLSEVGPQLAAQLLLLWAVADPHRLVLTLLGAQFGTRRPTRL
jgi:hypothetical protein